MDPDHLLYAVQFLAAIAFVLVCEFALRRRYEPGYTWVPATWGIAQVGLLVAVRLAVAPLPPASSTEAAVWWLWWLIFHSFLWAALPIWFWQLIIQDRRWESVLHFMERWR